MNKLPRPISPELIESGDVIEVEYKEVDGITVVKRGVVSYIQTHGNMRHFVTQYGATLAQYAIGGRPSDNWGKKFTLIARHINQTPMFDLMTETGRL